MRNIFCLIEKTNDCNRLAVAITLQGLYEKTVFVSICVIETGPAKACFVKDVLRRCAVESFTPEQFLCFVQHVLFIK